MKKKRSSFTLVEALIAMALFSIVIASLFSLFYHNVRIHEQLEGIKNQAETTRRAHARLQGAFSHLMHKIEGRHFFYSDKSATKDSSKGAQGVIFTFDNGLDRVRGFSYDVIAKLYVDQENRLALTIWPNPVDGKTYPKTFRKEILLENIESMNVQFWKAPNLKNVLPTEKVGEWIDSWEKELKSHPTLVKLTLTFDKDAKQQKDEKGQIPDLVFCFVTSVDSIESLKLE